MADVTVDTGEFIVSSNNESEDAIRAAFGADDTADPSAPEAPVEASADDDAGEPAAPAGEETAKTDETPKPKRGSHQARMAQLQADIDRKIAERRVREQELAELEARLSQTRSQVDRPEPVQDDQPPVTFADPADPEPQQEQFDTYEQWVKEVARWQFRQEYRQARMAEQAQVERQRVQAQFQETGVRVAQALNEARAARPDLVERLPPELITAQPGPLMDHRDVQVALRRGTIGWNMIAEALHASDRPAAMLTYFADHPDEVQRLATLPPTAVAAGLARIDERLALASTTASSPARISQAKPPIRPVGSLPSAGDDGELSDDLPIDEYIRRANARDRKIRAGR